MWRLELHKVGENVDGDREDDGAVVLGCDTVQSLQISELGIASYQVDWSHWLGLTWRAAGLSMITSAACLSDRLALCSPSAAITLARAFLAASASAAMALWSCSGTLTSFTSTLSTVTPHDSVATFKLD